MGKQTLLGKIMPEIVILCRNHILINRQNITDKTDNKINLKMSGKLSGIFYVRAV